MTISITVIRGDGDLQGEDIVDPMLSDTPAAIARGTQEINANTPIEPVTLETTYRAGLRVGQSVRVEDTVRGVDWVGVIVGLSHVFSGPTLYTKLEVERPV